MTLRQGEVRESASERRSVQSLPDPTLNMQGRGKENQEPSCQFLLFEWNDRKPQKCKNDWEVKETINGYVFSCRHDEQQQSTNDAQAMESTKTVKSTFRIVIN